MYIPKLALVNCLINAKLILSFNTRQISHRNTSLSMDYFNKKASDSSELVTAGGIILYRIEKNYPEFLLLKSHQEPFHYTPPKGRLEDGETFGDAAKRETMEESGISPEMYEIDESFFKSMKYKAYDKGKECVYFLAKLKDTTVPVVLSEEHINYEWANLEKVKELCSHQTIIDSIIEAYKHITKK